tara:strand:+ start:1396 stop:1677 length:282 start_codon:yes stop_codon:yes gene_type:complete
MKLEVEVEVPVYVTVRLEIDATESEIMDLYDLNSKDHDVEDYLIDYVNDHRHYEVVNDINLDSLNVSFDSRVPSRNIEVDVSEDREVMDVRVV